MSNSEPAEQQAPTPEPDSTSETSAQLPMTPSAEPSFVTSVLNGYESREPRREPETSVTLAPQALPIPNDEPLFIIAEHDELTIRWG